MVTRSVKASIFAVALLVSLQAQCVASCSVQPCGWDLKNAKLPPCHRKHLPAKNPGPCVQAPSASAPEWKSEWGTTTFAAVPVVGFPSPVVSFPTCRAGSPESAFTSAVGPPLLAVLRI